MTRTAPTRNLKYYSVLRYTWNWGICMNNLLTMFIVVLIYHFGAQNKRIDFGARNELIPARRWMYLSLIYVGSS